MSPSSDDLPAIRERLRHIDDTLASMKSTISKLAEAEARRSGREEATERALAINSSAAHERGRYVRVVMGWVPWLITLFGWAVVLWITASLDLGPQ